MPANLAARVLALAALTASSLMIARTLGPPGVAALSLLRVLPWLVGVVLGGGLYGAAPYFLAGPERADPRYRATFPAIAGVAGLAGIVVWLAVSPALHEPFLPQVSTPVLLFVSVTVLTQLLETTAKACSQGYGDLAGSNRIIVLEEALFVPFYLGLEHAGLGHYAAMAGALALGDIVTAGQGWLRLARRGYFRDSRPNSGCARRIVSYGVRAELSSIALLLNARFDFAIVAAIAGPAPLGVYAVASRYAELLRLPGLAMNYVLYPALAGSDSGARRTTRDALRRMSWVPVALAVPMAVAAPFVIPGLFGERFSGAVVPACVLLAGLAGCGVSGIVTAYLYALGRPGVVSAAQGAGVAVTVGLDLALIPRFGITGAAIASAVAYLTTTAALVALAASATAPPGKPEDPHVAPAGSAEPGTDTTSVPHAPRSQRGVLT